MAGKKVDDKATAAADDAAAARQAAHDLVDERHDRAEALTSVPQKVIDPNEAAALETITGQKPIRDESDAPPPGELGPHEESENPVADSADTNTSPKGDSKPATK